MNKKKVKDRPLTTEESIFIEQLLTDNKQYIKNIIYSELGDTYKYLAEDAIHDMYLLMCQKIDVLKAHNCPKAWILIASKRVAQGVMYKNRKDLQSVPLDNITGEADNIDVIEQVVYEIWLENKLPEKLIESLTPREREVYYKLYMEEKSVKETAEELSITANAVYNFNKNLKDKIKNEIKRK